MQTRWIQLVQRWPIRSLQTKATLLVIAIVGGVLALSTFLDIRVSERALERDLRDNAIALAQQFAGVIGSWEELNNPAMRQVDIGQVMEDRPSVVGVAVYATAQGVPHLITSSAEEVQPAQLQRLSRRPRGISRWRSSGGEEQAANGMLQCPCIFMAP